MEKQRELSTDIVQKYIIDGTCSAIRSRYASLAESAVRMNFGKLDKEVVVLDTETTGFSFSHDELIQIAAARMQEGSVTERFVTFVNPGQDIPDDITHLTGIHEEDIAEAPDPNEAVKQLVEFVGTSDIVAHNAEFDYSFTTKYSAGESLKNNRWIDSLDLARIALPKMKSHRLLDLVKAFSAPLSTHRADADVEALCVVYRILLAAVFAMPQSLVDEIAQMSDEDEWPTVFVFKAIAELKQSSRDVITSHDAKSPSLPFSLKNLRNNRMGKLPLKTRVDADDIAADPQRELRFPREKVIDEAFAKEGLVGKLYDKYEIRTEQVSMAKTVLRAFASSTNLAIEAGTGVGKSMAYLLPATLVAKENSITVGIATKTNALLDQLVFKELPLLAKALNASSPDEPFCKTQEPVLSSKQALLLDYVALKGFSHYPCLRRISRIVQDGPKSKEIAGKQVLQAPSLAALLSFIEQSEYDDIDSLKIDYRVLPRYTITTTSAECLRRKCPFFGALCFVHGARRRAEAADIIVTNHSLLFCDLVAEGGLLPSVRYWVVDEAHGTENEARNAFSSSLAADELLRLARRVAAEEVSQNVFLRAERRAATSFDDGTLFFALAAKAKAAGKTFEKATTEFLQHIKTLSFFDTNKRSKGYETVELWVNNDIRTSATFKALVASGKTFCDAIEKLITASQEIVGILEGIEAAAEAQREIASVAMGLKELLNAAEIILFKAPETYAYSATLSKKQDRFSEKLEAFLINVGDILNETLFARTHSVVFASATLTVADSFESFENAIGLNESEFSQAASYQLDSSYDFDNQMTVYVADDMPEPNDPTYLVALQQFLTEVHLSQGGSMLTLFTNRKEMEKCYDVVRAALKQKSLRLVCQKWGISPKALRDDFLADEHLSLFALKSFWEGFDAPGSTLKGVIIPKLPFAKPTDPLFCERAQRDSQAWKHYVLPAAVLEVKQAAGRLIRKSDDRGCLILADRRLLTKGYGKTFLASMPSRTIKVCSRAAIAKDLGSLYR